MNSDHIDALAEQLQGLNPVQRDAVQCFDKALLVLAGAGTGKTKVLVSRIAYILAHRLAWPSQILAVTFTNKAAQEMKMRIADALKATTDGLWLGTFHSLCLRILRRHCALIDRTSDFTVLDMDDQVRLIKQIMRAENLDEKAWPPRVIAGNIGRWKDKALSVEKAFSHSGIALKKADPSLRIYQLYQAQLKMLNALDFGDLLLTALELLMQNPEVLEQYHQQFKFILVDEYQDTNVVQYLWMRLLAQGGANICCVGDDDQSIYGWRGAEVTNILRFEQDFPGSHVIRLEQNYRSTPHILGAASGLIACNKGRLGKTLWTEIDQGHKVQVCATWDEGEEARLVASEILLEHKQHQSFAQTAVLVRAGFQTRNFEERFITTGIPYRIIGGNRFYEHLEIRDAVAYLRIIAQPNDSLAFERILNTPRRGIGLTTLQLLHQHSHMAQVPLLEAARYFVGCDDTLRGKTKLSLGQFIDDIQRWQTEKNTLKPSQLAQRVLEEAGYLAMWRSDKSIEAPGRLDNLKEFVRALDEFEEISSFLEHVSLVMDNNLQNNQDSVSVMTLHSAKGLEFDTVFLAGWEEGIFPNPRSLDESGSTGLEEERRLAYVGLTRARKKAIITHAGSRRIHGTWQTSLPSRFIEELPEEHLCVHKNKGTFRPNTAINHPKTTPSSPQKSAVHPGTKQNDGLSKNQRVFHQKFGYGIIRQIDGEKLEILFETAGFKRVMAGFIKKASDV